ncbi:MAG TPA: thioredoxin domain-containing protein [Enhygromyxa sp.]|nr:thioredoxin domain-containing protein [Enhygromyxa sp.]
MSEHEDDKQEGASDRPHEDDRTLEDSKSRSIASAPSPWPKSGGDESPSAKPEVEVVAAKAPKAAKPDDKKAKLLSNLVFVVGFLATLVLGYYVGQWVRVKFGDKPQPESGDRYRVELRGDEPQLGPDDALVTIIEFADYQCPYCADSVEPLKDAMSAYEGDVRLIFKHYPLPGHPNAAPAAYVSWAAHQQDHFWDFHDRLFESKASIDKVPEWVKEFGLDANKFGADMESSGAKQAVDSDMLAGAKVGVTGTPAFYVNGHLYRGKRSEVDWRKIIEAELNYAKELVDDGVARGELYEHLMKDALDRQPGAPDRKPAAKIDPATYNVPIDGRPTKGPETALVTVVEFADYHCPFCAKVTGDLDRLLEEHPNDVRLVYVQRPLPMHPNARDASKAALAAAKQGKFWEMHEKLFLRKSQKLEQFVKLAEELGLDVEQFKADYASEEVAAQLAEDQKLSDQLGVNGTPAFFINGRYLSGAQGYPVIEGLVQEELAEAKELVSMGTAPSKVYETVIANGKTTLPPRK